MQDIKKIKDNPDLFKKLVKDKNLKIDIDHLLDLYEKKSDFQKQLDELRKQRNENVDEIKKIGGKPSQELIDKGKSIKEEIAKLEEESKGFDEEFNKLMYYTPQIVSDDTPIGKDETENIEVKKWLPDTQPISKEATPWMKDHVTLGTSLNILDVDRGVKTGGFRGYYLKNEGALMHMGLMMLGMKIMSQKGFQNMVPPTIVKSDALWGSGHFPFDQESVYVVDTQGHTEGDIEVEGKDRKYLIGTAEPSLLNYYRDETIKKEQLPIKVAGFSQCYRGEVGSYGKDTKGIYRVHEFMKIEQVVICDGNYEESEKWHKEMMSYSEEFLQLLKLPYRVIQLCTGDMGAGKYKMFDIETWMPSRDSYGETHSASNLGDWQTRRLNVKVDDNGKKYYAHALNNTVIASPRVLIALWENYQNEDGTITVPEALRDYVGKDVIGK